MPHERSYNLTVNVKLYDCSCGIVNMKKQELGLVNDWVAQQALAPLTVLTGLIHLFIRCKVDVQKGHVPGHIFWQEADMVQRAVEGCAGRVGVLTDNIDTY